jgi:pimeloyl-ACP methyl ester carboxylesterase
MVRDAQLLSVLAVPGLGQDERVWGGLASELGQRYELTLLSGSAAVANRTADVILAIADAAPAAVYAARQGRSRAIALLAPFAVEVMPEINVDPRELAREFDQFRELTEQLKTIDDPEGRRTALADGLIRVMGRELTSIDLDRLREMFRDKADVALDPAAHGSWPGPYADDLAALQIPVLVLTAGQDERAAAVGRALAQRAPRGELVLLETAQTSFPWLAQPNAASAAVIRFLGKI